MPRLSNQLAMPGPLCTDFRWSHPWAKITTPTARCRSAPRCSGRSATPITPPSHVRWCAASCGTGCCVAVGRSDCGSVRMGLPRVFGGRQNTREERCVPRMTDARADDAARVPGSNGNERSKASSSDHSPGPIAPSAIDEHASVHDVLPPLALVEDEEAVLPVVGRRARRAGSKRRRRTRDRREEPDDQADADDELGDRSPFHAWSGPFAGRGSRTSSPSRGPERTRREVVATRGRTSRRPPTHGRR